MPPAKKARLPASKLPAITGLAAALAVVLTWLPDHPVSALGWLKSAPEIEFWRCFSCHFVHLGWRHLLLNLAALAGLAAIARFLGRQRGTTAGIAGGFAGALLAGMLGVCLGLSWWDAGVTWYVGLSGALYGVYAWLVLDLAALPDWPGRAAWGLYLAGLAKALLDAMASVGTLGLSGIPLAPPAHLYGLLGGSFWAALHYFLRVRRDR